MQELSRWQGLSRWPGSRCLYPRRRGTIHKISLTRGPFVHLIHGCRRAKTPGCPRVEAKTNECSSTRTRACTGRIHACSGRTHASNSERIHVCSERSHGNSGRTYVLLTPGTLIVVRTLWRVVGDSVAAVMILGNCCARIPASPVKIHACLHAKTHVWRLVKIHAWRARKSFGFERVTTGQCFHSTTPRHRTTANTASTSTASTSTVSTSTASTVRTLTCCLGRIRCRRKALHPNMPRCSIRRSIKWQACIPGSPKTKVAMADARVAMAMGGGRREGIGHNELRPQGRAWVAPAIRVAQA